MIAGGWEIYILLVGFILEFFLYIKYKFRAGGVVVLPLLAIYFIKFPALVPYLIVATLYTYFVLEYLYSKHIIYGRRLLYLSLVMGIIIALIITAFIGNFEWYGFLIPGLLAYNVHREKNSTAQYIKSVILNTFMFLFLVLLSFFVIYVV